MPSDTRWYAVHTQPQREARAELNLRQQGFATYLPRYKRIRSHARRKELVERPLFPRYLFIALDIARDRWRAVQSTFGVSNLVLVGETPSPLASEVVETIRRREDQDGFVRLGLPAGVSTGSSIRLLDGMFADHVAVLDRVADDYRVAVMLKLLGRDVRVLVSASSVGLV
jgi:transcriptional antiterminator RfaH